MKKYKVLKWLNRNIAKTPQGQLPPKWINILRRIFYPFQASYERQNMIRYDIMQDRYYIEGICIDRELLSFIKRVNDLKNGIYHGVSVKEAAKTLSEVLDKLNLKK